MFPGVCESRSRKYTLVETYIPKDDPQKAVMSSKWRPRFPFGVANNVMEPNGEPPHPRGGLTSHTTRLWLWHPAPQKHHASDDDDVGAPPEIASCRLCFSLCPFISCNYASMFKQDRPNLFIGLSSQPRSSHSVNSESRDFHVDKFTRRAPDINSDWLLPQFWQLGLKPVQFT